MRTEINKNNRIMVYEFIDGAVVAGNVDASVSLVFAFERVILQNRIKRILHENIATLFKSLPYAGRKFYIPPLEILMQPYVHVTKANQDRYPSACRMKTPATDFCPS